MIPYKWVEINNDMKVDELEFILVDLNKEGTKMTHSYWHHRQNKYFTSWILFIKWSIVLSMRPKITPDCDDMNNTEDNIDDIPSFSVGLPRGDNSEGND